MNVYCCKNMKIIILTTYLCVVSGAQVPPSPRSVNVALETSFLFEPKDVNDNISFIQNIKVFLDKLYKILAPQAQEMQQFRANDRIERRSSFTDFIHNVRDSFLNFTGPNVKHAVKVLKNEVSKITDNAKSGIHDVLPDQNIKQYVKDTLQKWSSEATPILKDKLKKIMKDNNPLLTTFARRLNDYYTEDDLKKLNKLLKKLNKHLDNDLDTTKIVKDALEIGITEKLKKLNATSKISLMNDMKLLSDFITDSSPKKSDKTPSIMKRNNDVDIYLSDLERDEREVPPPTTDSLEKDEIYNELKVAIGKKLKIANEKMKENDKNGLNTNEIVVDNVEMFVESVKQPDI